MSEVYIIVTNIKKSLNSEEKIDVRGVFSDIKAALDVFNELKQKLITDAKETLRDTEFKIFDDKGRFCFAVQKFWGYEDYHAELRIFKKIVN